MKKILIVEDDRKIAMAMLIRLTAHGYDVFTATDCSDGLRRCQDHLPDLAILDICLSRCSGLDVAVKIRQTPRTAGTLIIFMTASNDPDLVKRAEAMDAVAFMRKPFNDGELIAVVRKALGENESGD